MNKKIELEITYSSDEDLKKKLAKVSNLIEVMGDNAEMVLIENVSLKIWKDL